jgi:hypothetical protein
LYTMARIHSARIGTEWWSDCVGSAFMNTAVMRVADSSRNMMEEHQNANQQPTPSTTAFSSSPVVTHPDDDEDDVMFLFQTPLQPTTSQRRYLKADRRSSSVANSLHEPRTNKKRRLADPGDVIDLTDEPESVISDLTGQSLSPVPIPSNLAVIWTLNWPQVPSTQNQPRSSEILVPPRNTLPSQGTQRNNGCGSPDAGFRVGKKNANRRC